MDMIISFRITSVVTSAQNHKNQGNNYSNIQIKTTSALVTTMMTALSCAFHEHHKKRGVCKKSLETLTHEKCARGYHTVHIT